MKKYNIALCHMVDESKKVDTSQMLAFRLFNNDIADYVLVDTDRGYRVGVVINIVTFEEFIKLGFNVHKILGDVISSFSTKDLDERLGKRKRKKLLLAKMNDILNKFDNMYLYQILTKYSKEMEELYNEYIIIEAEGIE